MPEQFIVQPFSAVRGNIKPGKPIAARDERACRAEANRQASQGGAAALKIDIDEETGDTVKVTVLERIGALPENFDDTVGA